MPWKRTSNPSVATSILSTVKQHLRYTGSSEDTLIGTYIDAAFEQIEHRTNAQLLTATFEASLDCFPRLATCPLRLHGYPLQSVQSITYQDDQEYDYTWDDTEYEVLVNRIPGIVRPKQRYMWPTPSRNVVVSYTAGYGATWASLPITARHAVLLLAEHYFDQRAPVNIGNMVTAIPEGVESILMSLVVGDEFHEVA